MKKGKNPKDAIVHDIEYHDMFSAQRRTAIAVDDHSDMWYVADQPIHPCKLATEDA